MATREALRVLVVDDMESMRQLVCAILRGLGITRIHTAEDGVKAMAQLQAQPCDLALLDAEMPRMNGVDTLAAIRASTEFPGLPVIMITGRADTSFVKRIAELGVDGYLVKPVWAQRWRRASTRRCANPPNSSAPGPLVPNPARP